MPVYQTEKAFLAAVENPDDKTNSRKLYTESEINLIKSQFPGITSDFTAYLQEIGEGSFRECQFSVTGKLFDLATIGLEDSFEIKHSIKFFGDNYSGDFSGFDFESNDDKVIEFWHDSGELYETNKSFKEYIQEQMLMGTDGTDLRK